MSDKIKSCIACENTSEEAPLFKFKFKGNKYYVCSKHIPSIIHKPEELVGKLPGAESLIEE
jgi:hypothetical protein